MGMDSRIIKKVDSTTPGNCSIGMSQKTSCFKRSIWVCRKDKRILLGTIEFEVLRDMQVTMFSGQS